MPVYVNRIFNNRTKSEKMFSLLSLKNANAEDENQGVFTMIGTEHPKIFSLCKPKPGFQVYLKKKQAMTLSLKRYKRAQRFL